MPPFQSLYICTHIHNFQHTVSKHKLREIMRGDQVRLNNGMIMPVIGMGTYSFENDRKSTEQAVQLALKVSLSLFSLSLTHT